ncbi:MAG: hypothetical protein EAX89_12600 [Candidatus Lokiarchaeota archaeon]|nr:hypothetical protein [Candidatus Lokiarchaeota archaeon]
MVSAASDKSKVTFRPLSDWETNNPSIFYTWGGWPPGRDTPVYRILLADFFSGSPPPIGTYDGYIKERKLSDGRALVTVYLSLKDAPFWLILALDFPDPPAFPDPSKYILENAKMIEYREVVEFFIPFPGAPIPNLFDIAFEDYTFMSGVGHGIGVFTDYAESVGFTSGEEGMMTINQRGLVYAAFQNGFNGALRDCFPAEIINVHQIG